MKEKVGWMETELGQVCYKIVDGTHHTPEYTETGVPFISVKDIYNENVNFSNCRHVSYETHNELIKRCHPEPSDLLITKSGTIGRMAIVPNKPEFSLFVSVALLKNYKSIINTKFLLYSLENYLNSINISQDIKGGLLKNFHLEDIRVTKINLAPLPEQRAIVSKIEQLFSELDNGIANLKLAQEQLKVYRQAVLKKAFEGELTKKWQEQQTDLPDAEELLEQIRKEREEAVNVNGKKVKSTKPLTEEELAELPKLPEGWKWVKIGDVSNCLDSQRVPVNKSDRIKRAGNIPYYGANGQVGWIDDYLFDEPLVLVVEDETFTGREKPFSYLITGKSWVNNHAHILQPTSGLDVDFLNYQLSYYPFTPLTTGTTGRKKLTQFALTNAPFKICSLPEQQAIVQEIETRLSVCDKIEQDIETNLEKAEALRQSILKKAFEGKLLNERELAEVRGAEDWESAEVLLERIRKERARK